VPLPVVAHPVAIQMGLAVVLSGHALLTPAQVQAVPRVAPVVGYPQLGLGCGQPAVEDDEAQMALLAALGAPVGQRDELARLPDAAQPRVQRQLGRQLVVAGRSTPQRRVQHREGVGPARRPGQVDRAAGRRDAWQPFDQRRFERQGRLVRCHASDVRERFAGGHNHVYAVAAEHAEPVQLGGGVVRERHVRRNDAAQRLQPRGQRCGGGGVEVAVESDGRAAGHGRADASPGHADRP